MARFLFLSSSTDLPTPIHQPPTGYEIDILDQYAFETLGDADLHRYDGLILPGTADQYHLATQAARLDRFLDRRAILVNGPVSYRLLPELAAPFTPLPERGRRDLAVTVLDRSDVFAGVADDDLTFRRGVAGFWGRGVQPAPATARILSALGAAGAPFDWSLIRAGGGRLFVHPGNDVWSFADGTSSADRVWPQTLAWLVAQ